MLRNATHVKKNLLDKGRLGLQVGQGYYGYPNPAYAAPDFLAVPGLGSAKDIARLAKLSDNPSLTLSA